jgi:diguanylate cyclase (GGDEF)-like protein
MLAWIMRRLARRSRAFVLTLSALAVALLAVVDYLTGPELRFFIFYWPPIALATWSCGRRWGLAFVALSGVAWVTANVPETRAASSVLVWNTGVNLASFALFAYVVTVIREMVNRERAAARTDPLTGAANSRAFLERVGLEIRRCSREEQPLSLAYLDADDFKHVNDRLGHAAGDELLRRATATILSHVRSTDCLARLGGDEFALLMPGTDAVAAEQVMARILSALQAVATATGLPVSFSVGVVTSAGGQTAEQLVAAADAVMYEVKAAGKGSVRAGASRVGSPDGPVAVPG